jgi:hypothetical protein
MAWVLTQGGGRCATLPWAIIRQPLRGAGRANQALRATSLRFSPVSDLLARCA